MCRYMVAPDARLCGSRLGMRTLDVALRIYNQGITLALDTCIPSPKQGSGLAGIKAGSNHISRAGFELMALTWVTKLSIPRPIYDCYIAGRLVLHVEIYYLL